MKNFIFIFLLLTLNFNWNLQSPNFGASTCLAQKYHFQTYSLEEGLSQSQLTAMFLDSRGNVWLGTHGGGADIFNGKSFIHHTRADGLINNKIFSIAEDSRGNIWLGTYGDGACRYDGKSYTSFTRKEGLADNRVRSILKDSKENLWFGTAGGGATMLAKESQWEKDFAGANISTYNKDNGLGGNHVWSMMEDHQGNIWFALFVNGLTKLVRKDSLTPPRFVNYTVKNGLPGSVVKVFEDSRHNIWVGTHESGVCRIIPVAGSDSVRIVNYSKKNGFISDYAGHAFVEDNNSNLWISSDDGCAIVDLSDAANYENPGRIKFLHLTEKNGLPKNRIWTMVKDNDGNIWLGTDGGGVSKYCADGFTYYTKEFGLSNNTVWSVIEDKKGNIWAGTDGGGINKLIVDDENPTEATFRGYKTEDGISNNTVFSLMQDSRGNIWLGSAGRGVNRFNPGNAWQEKMTFETFPGEKKLSNTYVYSVMEDRNGNVWIGNRNGAAKYIYDQAGRGAHNFKYYMPRDGSSMVMSMREDSRGFIWFGTQVHGVNRYDPQQDTTVGNPFTNYSEENGLSNNYVTAIAEDDLGNMWFGTYGGGVSMLPAGVASVFRNVETSNLDASTGKKSQRLPWEYFSARDGLSDDAVGPMLFDEKGDLWICTIKGISKLNIQEYRKSGRKQFRNFSGLEGFLGIEATSVCQDHKGNFWFGTPNMLIKYNPREDKPNMTEPLTRITGIRLFYENVHWSEFADSTTPWYFLPAALSLPYNKNHLSFDFIGISLRIPEKVNYRFILEGLDNDWSPVTQKNEAVYSNIPPGEYTFKVKACNNDGVWNKEPVTFSFIITPPFWRTWWFYIVCFLLVVAGVTVFIKIRERNLRREKRILEEKVRQRTVLITKQKEELDVKNKDITDSIRYARDIQRSILPTDKQIKEFLPESFILFKPKDIVSGDFYFFAEVNQHKIIATCDSTGHGVPGAFVSMLGSQLLNEIVNDKSVTDAAEVLNQLRKGIVHAFGEEGTKGERKEGMDMSLCVFNLKTNQLQYSGAYNPLYIICNKKNLQGFQSHDGLKEIKADKQPVGYNFGRETPFTNHEIQLEKGDTIYMSSDGYQDQFGGPDGRKFMRKQLKQLFLDIFEKSMEEQKEHLNKTIEGWKRDGVQTDDILVIGVRV